MSIDVLSPQSEALFKVGLEQLAHQTEREIQGIKAALNARGLLHSSIAAHQIRDRADSAIGEMGNLAEECARHAYEASHVRFSDRLEGALIESFECNFASGYQRVAAIRESSVRDIESVLMNKNMLDRSDNLNVEQLARIKGQAELRRYFQTIKRSQKRWFEHLPIVGKIITWILRLFMGNVK